jgi:hypothetical protein
MASRDAVQSRQDNSGRTNEEWQTHFPKIDWFPECWCIKIVVGNDRYSLNSCSCRLSSVWVNSTPDHGCTGREAGRGHAPVPCLHALPRQQNPGCQASGQQGTATPTAQPQAQQRHRPQAAVIRARAPPPPPFPHAKTAIESNCRRAHPPSHPPSSKTWAPARACPSRASRTAGQE